MNFAKYSVVIRSDRSASFFFGRPPEHVLTALHFVTIDDECNVYVPTCDAERFRSRLRFVDVGRSNPDAVTELERRIPWVLGK